MKYLFDPAAPIMRQLRFMDLPEHLPVEEAIVYRFFDEAHKNKATWWSDVRAVSVEHYPHERAALDAEVAAIKAERPPFNRRSIPASLKRNSCAAHEGRARSSESIPPRVGGGVGVRGEVVAKAAFHLTTRGLWITRRPADRRPMQQSQIRGVR